MHAIRLFNLKAPKEQLEQVILAAVRTRTSSIVKIGFLKRKSLPSIPPPTIDTMQRSLEIQTLLDRAAIRDVLMRYFHGCDTGDKALVRSCFTQDVAAHYAGREPVRGVDALIGQIALFENLATGLCRISTHFAGNLQFKEVTADHAETENNAFAFLVNTDGTTVEMRSLRYLDRLRREQGQWKISARLHTLDWSSSVPCTFARAFERRLNSIAAQLPLAPSTDLPAGSSSDRIV